MRKKALGGRIPVQRTLPPLAETCAKFKGFRAGVTRLDQVYELLAAVIQRYRRPTPLPFYAMREATAFFGVSLKTMAKVYHRLGREGVLTVVRSSQSMVAARTPRPRFAIRGVVCMPIWQPGHLQFLDWRSWFSQLEEELAHYHFVLQPIFYKYDEEVKPAFVDRILRFNPDYLLWSWPRKFSLPAMQSIAETGVPLVLVQDDEKPFPGKGYQTSYARGLREGLAEWAASGEIREIVMPRQSKEASPFLPMLKAGPLPCRFESMPMRNYSAADFLAHLWRLAPDRRTGVFFAEDLQYAHLCALMPEAMLEFMRQRRVLVLRQVTIPLPLGNKMTAGITVDALIHPWKKLARRIAMDLGRSKAGTPSVQTILEAEWRPKTPVASMMKTIFQE